MRKALASSLALTGIVWATGCGTDAGGSSSTDAGQDAPFARGQAIIAINTSVDATCKSNRIVSVGSFGETTAPSSPVVDGDYFEGKRVSVKCRVAEMSAKNGFVVDVDILVRDGVAITFGAATDGFGASQTADLRITGELPRAGCIVDPRPVSGGVAPGRFWARVSCPSVVSPSACGFEGTIKVENCTP